MTGEVELNVKEEVNEANGPNTERENQNRGHEGGRRGGGSFRGGRFNGSPRKEMKMEGDMEMGSGGGGGGRIGGGRGGYRGRGHMGGGNRGHSDTGRGENAFLNERTLKAIQGPTIDLPPKDTAEKKFNGRCRLYVGNLPPDVSEDEFKKLFEQYGETSEVYINKEKNFAFIRLDYRSTAERAKRELDGHPMRNRNLRVRFAPLGATVKVKNLSQYVTNELLELAFSVFGEVERAVVSVDDRGNSLREGVVEFSRKGFAQSALRYCQDACYFLTSSLKPVIIEPYEPLEDTDGYSEKCITKKGGDFFEAREIGPRFAAQGSFEHEFGTRWKQIYELFRQKEEALKREMKLEEEKLEAQLQYAKYEHETEVLREKLRQRELDRERQRREWELKEKQAEEQRAAEEEALRRHQEDLSRRMLHQDDELRRRQQENSLFMQESSMRQSAGYSTGGAVDPAEAMRHYDAMDPAQRQADPSYLVDSASGGGGYRSGAGVGGGRYGDEMDEMGSRRAQGQSGGGARWAHHDRRPQEDFPNKRRRY